MNLLRIPKNLLVLVVLVPLLFSLSGCIYMVVGGIGAVGGYIVSPDTVEGISENDYDIMWDTAVETMEIMGMVNESNEAGGMMIATVNGAKVTLIVVALGESTTKLTVKARKAYLPKISLAQNVFVKIMGRVNE